MKLKQYIAIVSIMLTAWLSPALAQEYVAVVCAGDTGVTYYVQGLEGSTFDWTISGGTIVQDFNDSIKVDWGSETGEFELSVIETTSYGCVGQLVKGTVLVTGPFVNIGEDLSICEGDTIQLSVEGNFTSFEWSDGSVTTTIDVFDEGTVSLIAFDQYGCMTEDEVYVDVIELPDVELGEDLTICDLESVTLDAGPDGIRYLWSTGETSRTIDIYYGSQEIWVVVDDEFGCQNSDSLIVEACFFDGLFDNIPTAITPSNQDGRNDVWNIEPLQSFPEAIVDIYDRWGRLVWRSEPGYPTPWNGKDLSGRDLPMDSYHFVILLNFADQDHERVVGTITIIR